VQTNRLGKAGWETGIATSCDLTGKPISGAPRWSGDVGGEYTRGLTENLQASGGIEYNFRSSSYYTSDDSAYSLIGGYGLVNLHVSIGSTSDRWQVSLWARNVFNKEYFASPSVGGAYAAGYVAGTVGDPRTYGATLRSDFRAGCADVPVVAQPTQDAVQAWTPRLGTRRLVRRRSTPRAQRRGLKVSSLASRYTPNSPSDSP